MNDFFVAVRRYLLEYLPLQKCCSENTIRSYRQTLNLFVTYLTEAKRMKLNQIEFKVFNRELFAGFLNWIENDRKCGASTRNHRLMALRSFFNYAGVWDCAQISIAMDLSVIPMKKETGKIVGFLTEDALRALLSQASGKKRSDVRNQFFMILMYDTAARCSELLNMRVGHLRLNEEHPLVYLNGKGNKPRTVPLMPKTVAHCKHYLECFHSNSNNEEYLFFTVIHGRRQPMSADTVASFVKLYGADARKACSAVPDHIHPHMLRHTRAMHLYREGMPMVLLSEFLGHASVESTKIYAFADTEMKRAAIEKADSHIKGHDVPIPVWLNDEDMILVLSGLKQ